MSRFEEDDASFGVRAGLTVGLELVRGPFEVSDAPRGFYDLAVVAVVPLTPETFYDADILLREQGGPRMEADVVYAPRNDISDLLDAIECDTARFGSPMYRTAMTGGNELTYRGARVAKLTGQIAMLPLTGRWVMFGSRERQAPPRLPHPGATAPPPQETPLLQALRHHLGPYGMEHLSDADMARLAKLLPKP